MLSEISDHWLVITTILLTAGFFLIYDHPMHELELRINSLTAGRSIKGVALGVMNVSCGQLKRMKFSGGILVDGVPKHTDYRLKEGDCLRLCFPDAAGMKPDISHEPLAVVWEDEDILIIDKPAPLPSVASRQGGETLENRVFSYLGCPENFVYRPVNRLDKGTSGLMMAAKNAHIQQRMQHLLHTDHFIREYLAVVDGRPPEDKGVIVLPIAHGPGIRRVISGSGRYAATEYELLQTGKERSLVRLRLQTGRTHQIRVHLSSLGCPVAGDFLYGQEEDALPGRFALHAFSLCFCHPISGEWVKTMSPMPDEMQELLVIHSH